MLDTNKILDGKKVAEKIRANLKMKVALLKDEYVIRKLAVILIGDDYSSQIYVRNKSKACEEIGIEYEQYTLTEKTTEDELLALIDKLNKDITVHGILLQSPVPRHIDINRAIKMISPKKDVDGFHPENIGKLALGQDGFVSCTPYGVEKLLEEYNIELEGKHIVIVGRSNIVGKPMALNLLNKNATITICHSKTKNIENITKLADIVIVAIGNPRFLKVEMVKAGAIIIDVGINRDENGKIVGDVDFKNILDKVKYITPVPGGVGPMTIAMLMENVVKACNKK